MACILIADSSRDILEVMGYLLGMEGDEIKVAVNKEVLFAQIAISIPNLIILDTFLEGGKGKEICKEINSNETLKNVPIILMSTNEKILNDYKDCGAIDILTKPFHFPELKKKIKSALELTMVG